MTGESVFFALILQSVRPTGLRVWFLLPSVYFRTFNQSLPYHARGAPRGAGLWICRLSEICVGADIIRPF